jgi:hypothetical protein
LSDFVSVRDGDEAEKAVMIRSGLQTLVRVESAPSAGRAGRIGFTRNRSKVRVCRCERNVLADNVIGGDLRKLAAAGDT